MILRVGFSEGTIEGGIFELRMDANFANFVVMMVFGGVGTGCPDDGQGLQVPATGRWVQ